MVVLGGVVGLVCGRGFKEGLVVCWALGLATDDEFVTMNIPLLTPLPPSCPNLSSVLGE